MDINQRRCSPETAYNLRLAVLSLTSASNLCLLIALISNHWTFLDPEKNLLYMGIWNICTPEHCFAHGWAGYVKAALIVSIIFGVLFNAFAGFQVKYSDLYFQKVIGSGMLSIGFVEMYGMAHATIILIFVREYVSFSWAYYFGWLAVGLAIVAGCFSYYHHSQDPPIPDTIILPTPDPIKEESDTAPPPYSIAVS